MKVLISSLSLLLLLTACSTNIPEGTSPSRISPALAAVESLYIAPLSCQSSTCPSDLSAYQAAVRRAVEQRSDFRLVSAPEKADAKLSVVLRSMNDRSGSSWGSDKGAAVAFDVLVLTRAGQEIWRDVTSVHDEALSDNILKIKEAKFSWLTTPELFSRAVGKSLKKLSKDRQSLYIR